MPFEENITPPIATKKPESQTHHGNTRTDDYGWLRDEKWQEVLKDPTKLSAGIRAHIDAENAYTSALTAPLKPLQETLFEEMKGRISEDDRTAPMQDGNYRYYKRMQAGKQYWVYCRTYGKDGAEEVYFDANREAANHKAEGRDFYKTEAVLVSPDHTRLALVEDTNGSEIFTLRVLDIATGDELTPPFTGVAGDIIWAADSHTLFYTVVDDNHRPYAVYRHQVGTDVAENTLVYREEDAGFFLELSKSSDANFLFIEAGGHTTSEWHFLDAHTPLAPFTCFKARVDDVEYTLDHGDGWFYILTNEDGATDFKICACPTKLCGKSSWKEVVPHKAGWLIDKLLLVKGYLLRQELANATPQIVVRNLSTGTDEPIGFEEPAYDLSLEGSRMYNTSVVRFTYQSPATPRQVFDFDLASGERNVVKTQQVPSGHNPDDYILRRTFATSHDGAQVPVTVFAHKDTPLDGSAPLWLYGYGSYGTAWPAIFSVLRLSLVNHGFVFAIAHIRGGTEKGYGWYLDAKKEKKVNTFHDFIAAAEQLIAEGYTSAGNIYAEGRSAGGMLMGAVTHMRPDLWKLVHLGVPFVDVLNTMCDPDLPLTPPEWPEWGNPLESAEEYANIAAYCPYQNLTPKAYPHTLVTSSVTDFRVTYWEPAKYAAKMREVNTADTFTIMKMEIATGHGGASGRYDALKEDAFEFSVVLTIFGRA